MQREKFAELMRQQRIPRVEGDSWGDMFKDVANACKKGRVLVVIDEISWMGSKDPAFLGNIHHCMGAIFQKKPSACINSFRLQFIMDRKKYIKFYGICGSYFFTAPFERTFAS